MPDAGSRLSLVRGEPSGRQKRQLLIRKILLCQQPARSMYLRAADEHAASSSLPQQSGIGDQLAIDSLGTEQLERRVWQRDQELPGSVDHGLLRLATQRGWSQMWPRNSMTVCTPR